MAFVMIKIIMKDVILMVVTVVDLILMFLLIMSIFFVQDVSVLKIWNAQNPLINRRWVLQ